MPTIRSHAVGAQAIGTPCNTNGDSGCLRLKSWLTPRPARSRLPACGTCVDTGRTIYKLGTIKEMLSGCELIIAQTLFYGDIYDPGTGGMIGSQYTESQVPTAMDMKGDNMFTVTDVRV